MKDLKKKNSKQWTKPQVPTRHIKSDNMYVIGDGKGNEIKWVKKILEGIMA